MYCLSISELRMLTSRGGAGLTPRRPRRTWATNRSGKGGCGRVRNLRVRRYSLQRELPMDPKFLLEVQSWELTLEFSLLASVREGVTSNPASLLLHCASRLTTAPRCAWLAVVTPQLALLVRFLARDLLLLWL
jgi:hypothetical protein